jgi:flagellar motor switch protein FliN/FliY
MPGLQAAALAGQWSQEFVHVMEAMADLRPEMEATDAPVADASGSLWWKQSLDLAPRAILWIGTPEQTWMALGRQILTAAGVETITTEEIRSSYLEVLRQSMSAFANALGSQLDREVLCTEGVEQAPSNLVGSCRVSIRVDSGTLPEFVFRASTELLDILSRAVRTEEAPAAAVNSDAGSDQDTVDVSRRVFNTLDLLLDVEMPVSVSFGRTQVRIQDILKLITGSIIELDRAISEPVEVIVNNCVIARGEVVVVEGNYGVRINEVMSRQQRLQESRRYLLPVHHR